MYFFSPSTHSCIFVKYPVMLVLKIKSQKHSPKLQSILSVFKSIDNLLVNNTLLNSTLH